MRLNLAALAIGWATTVTIAMLIVVGVGVGVKEDVSTGKDERAQLCAFVDREHNRERESIVRGERELYTKFAKSFASFTDTPEKQKQIHANSKRNYREIRLTRPPYCANVRKNPVPPYPSLDEIRKGTKPVAPALMP